VKFKDQRVIASIFILVLLTITGCGLLNRLTNITSIESGTSCEINNGYVISGSADHYTNVKTIYVGGTYSSPMYDDLVYAHVYINDNYYKYFFVAWWKPTFYVGVTTTEAYLPAGSYYVKINAGSCDSDPWPGGELAFTVSVEAVTSESRGEED